MSAKDKVVATLINHWYCMNRSHELGILKRMPKVDKYRERLDGIETADDKTLKSIDDHFCKQNRKALVWILSHILKLAGAENGKVEAKSRGKTMQVVVPIKDFNHVELSKYLAILRAPDQFGLVSTLLAGLPAFGYDDTGTLAALNHEIKCGQTEFYDNLSHVDRAAVAVIEDSMRFLSLCRLIRDKLTKEELAEALAGQLHVVFKTLEFDGCDVAISTFETSETVDAKANRELKARLEEAMNRRIKKVSDLAVSAGSIKYTFEDTQITPITFNLDILTDW